MIETCLLLLGGASVIYGGYHPPDDCYHHFDHAAKYKLCHDDRGYPTREINLVLESHPDMKDLFYEDNHPIPAPSSHYASPPQAVCPYNRYTLYSFFYANKDCYVIYPAVQKIMYVQCSANNNYDCQRCASYGGVSKCVEDYDYRYVWAYCLPHSNLKPVEVQPTRRPEPLKKFVPQYLEATDPILYYGNGAADLRNNDYPKSRRGSPQARIDYPYARVYRDSWNKVYRPYFLQHRWKRSYHTAPAKGTIERLKLYLPHHCGCKNYVC